MDSTTDDDVSNMSIHGQSTESVPEHQPSQLSSSAPSYTSPSLMVSISMVPTISMPSLLPLSSTINQQQQQQGEQEIPASQPVIVSETICISSDDADDDEEEEEEVHSDHPTGITTALPEQWLPPATSTPLSPRATTNDPHEVQTEQEIEEELFDNIHRLVRDFVERPHHRYPYYRVIRWRTGEQSNIEHVLTIVINRPTIIL